MLKPKCKYYVFCALYFVLLLLTTNKVNSQSKLIPIDTFTIKESLSKAESLQYINPDSSIYITNKIISSLKNQGHELYIQANYIKGTAYYHAGTLDSSISVLKNVLELSQKHYNHEYEVKSINNIGLVYLKRGDYQNTIDFMNRSIEKAKQYSLIEREAAGYNNLGLIFRELGLNDQSLNSMNKAYKIYSSLTDTISVITVLNNMGLIYKDLNDYEGAMACYVNALGLTNKLDNIDLKSMLYLNIGVLYNIQDDYDKALYYFEKSLKLKKILNYTYDLAIIYSDIADVHLYKKNYKEAIKYYKKSVEIYEKIGSLKDKINVHCNICNVYIISGNLKEAKNHILILEDLTSDKSNLNLRFNKWVYRTYTDYYEKAGDYKESLKYSKLYNQINDSIQKNQFKEKVAQQKIIHDLDLKELEIERLKAENELNNIKTEEQEKRLRNNNYIFTGILIIIIIGFILLYFLFRQVKINRNNNKILNENRKELLEKNYEITQQNEEIKSQSDRLYEINEDLMQLKTAVDATDNAVVILDKFGNYQWGNKGFDKMYEIPFKEFKKIYPNVLDALKTHSNADELYKIIKNCIDNLTPGNYEFSDVNKFGDQISIHTNIKAVTDISGEVLSIIMIDTDITEKVKTRKLLELKNYELKKQQEEIRTQTKQLHFINRDLLQFKSAVNETDNAIVILDPKGYFIWGNKGFENLYGFSFRDYIKKYPNILDTHETSVNKSQVLKVIKSCIYNKTPGNYEYTTFKGGKKVWIQSSIKAVTDSKGIVQNLIVIDTDISDKVNTARLIEIKNYELERQREENDASLRYAQNIQKAILPAPLNMQKNNDFFLIYMPKDIVSGDFYWFSDKKDSPYTYFAVVDCTGHGVPGAFMSMIGARMLNNIVNERNIYLPSQILEEMSTSIKIALKQKLSGNRDGMDISICRIEKEGNSTKEVVFSGAMQSVFYYNSKLEKLKKIKGDIKSIGGHYYDDISFTDTKIKVNINDILYLFSDGYIDQDSPEGKKFGSAKLAVVLKKIAKQSLSEQKEYLLKTFHNHKKDENQRDDITFLGIKIG